MTDGNQLNVLITVDTEVWCSRWGALDGQFPRAFRACIYGPTPRGDYGLPFQLKMLNDHGLRAVYFVETLFATRFGLGPLEEIVGLITQAGQSVELHVHTEWVDEALKPILPLVTSKRQHLRHFTFEEQGVLLRKGIELLAEAGAGPLHAFRAGNFGANRDTLRTLHTTGIRIDSSSNRTAKPCAIRQPLEQPTMLDGVLEVPVTVFTDGFGRLRPAQVTACSLGEMKAALEAARRRNRKFFVMLTHPFEFLNGAKTRKNPIVVKRFAGLCRYLADHRARFPTIDFSSPKLKPAPEPVEGLRASRALGLGRLVEQAWGRLTGA